MNVFKRTLSSPFIGLLALLFIAACGGSDTVEPYESDPSRLFWRLDVNHTAVMLSTDESRNTFQLEVVPRNVFGDPLPFSDSIAFIKAVAIDTTVHVSSSGLITAHAPTTSQTIYVRLTVGGITRADTVRVRVVEPTQVKAIKSIAVQAPTDSTWLWPVSLMGVNRMTTLNSQARDMNDALLSSSEWIRDIRSDNADIITVRNRVNNQIRGTLPGETWVYTNLYAYDRSLRDSLRMSVVESPIKLVSVGASTPVGGERRLVLYPGVLEIPVGGTVVWDNGGTTTRVGNRTNRVVENGMEWSYTDSLDIVFDKPDLVLPGIVLRSSVLVGGYLSYASDPKREGGNIPLFGYLFCFDIEMEEFCGESEHGDESVWGADAGRRSRSFPTAGTYTYTSERYPYLRGTIVVR